MCFRQGDLNVQAEAVRSELEAGAHLLAEQTHDLQAQAAVRLRIEVLGQANAVVGDLDNDGTVALAPSADIDGSDNSGRMGVLDGVGDGFARHQRERHDLRYRNQAVRGAAVGQLHPAARDERANQIVADFAEVVTDVDRLQAGLDR